MSSAMTLSDIDVKDIKFFNAKVGIAMANEKFESAISVARAKFKAATLNLLPEEEEALAAYQSYREEVAAAEAVFTAALTAAFDIKFFSE